MKKGITINDIAKISNTSKTTVSFYLNGKYDKMSSKTREKIQQVIEEYHYVPNTAARSLTKKKTEIIGVIVGKITTGFSNKLISGIEDEAIQKNYMVLVGSSYFDKERELYYIRNMIRSNVDGFIIQPSQEFEEALNLINSYGKKIVFVDSYVENCNVDSVRTNNYVSTKMLTEMLQQEGFRQCALIQANPEKITTRIERRDGFLETVEKENFYGTLCIENDVSNVREEEIEKFIENIIRTKKKTAIFVSNCWFLPKMYQIITQRKFENHLWKDFVVYGFDNEDWALNTNRQIPIIVQPAYEEGQRSFQLLYDRLSTNRSLSVEKVLDCKIYK